MAPSIGVCESTRLVRVGVRCRVECRVTGRARVKTQIRHFGVEARI